MMLMMLAAPARPGISNAQSPPLNHRAWGVTCRPTDLKWVAHSFMKRPPTSKIGRRGLVRGRVSGNIQIWLLYLLYTIYYYTKTLKCCGAVAAGPSWYACTEP